MQVWALHPTAAELIVRNFPDGGPKQQHDSDNHERDRHHGQPYEGEQDPDERNERAPCDFPIVSNDDAMEGLQGKFQFATNGVLIAFIA